MVSVDVRTRRAADVRPVDPDDFFGDELPARLRQHGGLAVPGARELEVRPFGVQVGEHGWTIALDGDGFRAGPGLDDAHAVARLTSEQLADLVNDLCTPMGLFTGGDLDMPAGRLEDFLDWWVVLRSVLDGVPAYTAGSVTFVDRDGAPLDLGRSFGPDDDRDNIAHFLSQAGFLHLRGVFDEDEMAAVSADMDAAAPEYSQGDGRSWWARTADGTDRLVRMQHFQTRSETMRRLVADERFTRIGALCDDGHRFGKPGSNENLVEALVKPIGVVEGISDVPWHKDCSLGSHSYRCCSLTVGISVTGADDRSGQLRVVAGSHRALIQPAFVRRGLDLPQLELPTATGDVTVHLSCTLHMAQPPVDQERRVLYTDFRLPDDGPDPGEAKLARIREGAPTTVSQPPATIS